jgi:hypothetical protein
LVEVIICGSGIRWRAGRVCDWGAGVEDLDGLTSKVDGKKLKEDVASANRANSVGDENPSGSDSITLVESIIMGGDSAEDIGAAGFERAFVGCGISCSSGSGLSSGLFDIEDGTIGVGVAV